MKKGVAVILLLLTCLPGIFAQLSFGGEITGSAEVIYFSDKENNNFSGTLAASNNSVLTYFGENIELGASLLLKFNTPSSTLSLNPSLLKIEASGQQEYSDTYASLLLNELYLQWFIGDSFLLKAGLFTRLRGFANVISPVHYLHSNNYEELLNGKLTQSINSSVLVTGSFLGDILSIELTGLLWQPFNQYPNPSSYLFPSYSIPKSITIPIPSVHDIYLGNIFLNDHNTDIFDFKRIGAQLDVSLMFSAAEFQFNLYYGIDSREIFDFDISFPSGLDNNYDVTLTPQTNIILAPSLSAIFYISDLQLYFDASYNYNRYFQIGDLTKTASSTTHFQNSSIAFTAGLQWDFWQINSTIVIEYADEFIMVTPEVYEKPMLAQCISFAFRSDFFESQLLVETMALLSFNRSVNSTIFTSIIYSPEIEWSIKLNVPVFIGSLDTVFGEYSKIQRFSLEFIYIY